MRVKFWWGYYDIPGVWHPRQGEGRVVGRHRFGSSQWYVAIETDSGALFSMPEKDVQCV